MSELTGGETAVQTSIRKPSRRGIRAIEIGVAVLRCLSDGRSPISLKEVAERTGLSASNAHFYLASLVETELARRDPVSGRYALGTYALQLGLSAMEQIDAISAARHSLYVLTEATGFSSFLNVWGSHGPTVVHRVDGKHRTVLEIRVGSTLPVLRSSAGRVFLTWLPWEMTRGLVEAELAAARPEDAQEALEAGNEADRLAAEVRANGIARASGTVLSGFTSIAAPVWDHAGTLQAVVSIVGPIGILDDRPDGMPARTLLQETRRISACLGWRAEVEPEDATSRP